MLTLVGLIFSFVVLACAAGSAYSAGADNATTAVTVTPRVSVAGVGGASRATLDSMSAVKSVPITIQYMYFNDSRGRAIEGSIPVRDILVDVVNKNLTLLRPYNVSIEFRDTNYRKAQNLVVSFNVFNTFVTSPCNDRQALPLFFGPENSNEAMFIATIAPYYNLVLISSNAGTPALSDSARYPTFFRTEINLATLAGLPRALMTYFNYTDVGLFAYSEPYSTEPGTGADLDLRQHGFNVLFYSVFRTKNNNGNNKSLDDFVSSIQVFDARILMGVYIEPDSYLWYCYILKYFGGPEVFNSKKYLFVVMGFDPSTNTQVLAPENIKFPGCTNDALDAMHNGTLVVGLPTWTSNNYMTDWGISVGDMQAKIRQVSGDVYGEPNIKFYNTLPQLVDAFYAGFLALDAVDRRLRAEVPPRSILDFTVKSNDIMHMTVEEMKKLQFHGVLGPMALSDNATLGNYIIRQYAGRNAPVFERFQYDPVKEELIVVSKPVFNTVDGRAPADKKPPVPPGSNTTQIIVIAVVLGSVVILAAALVYGLYRRNLAQNLAKPNWLVPYETIIFRDSAGGSSINRSSIMSGGSANTQWRVESNTKSGVLSDGQAVILQELPSSMASKLNINLPNHRMLSSFRDKLLHSNLRHFVGYTIAPANSNTQAANVMAQYLLWEFCEKGTVEDLVEAEVEMVKLDAAFELSLLLDVAQGIGFIHKSFIKVHGTLTLAACFIDKRFSVKIGHYGNEELARLFNMRSLIPPQGMSAQMTEDDNYYGRMRLYWAPELLRCSAAAVEVH